MTSQTEPLAQAAPARDRLRRRATRLWAVLRPYAYLAPLIGFMGLFVYVPILVSADLSFREWDFMSPTKPFVGLENYQYLFENRAFWNALWVTTVFAVVSVPLRLGLALLLAAALMREALATRLLRGALFLPAVTSTVAVAVVFSWVFATDHGLANALIGAFGGARVMWMQDGTLALMVLIFVNTWKQLGYDVILYVAALQAIPQELYDAAAVDGGRRRHVFWRITVPLVMPTTYFLLVISVIDAFQVFTIVDVMTRGGPAGATDMLVNMLYRVGFTLFDIGTGSALAMLLFVFLMVLALIKGRLIGRKVHYEA